MHPIWGFVSLLTYQRVAIHARSPAICLTFDDGPHPQQTPRLLALLRRHGVRASFFLQGRYVEQFPHLVTQLVADGHAIGNHSFSHPSFVNLPLRLQVEEIKKTDALLEQFDGQHRHLFRPPNGKLTASVIAWCLLNRRRIVLWTHDSLDFRLPAEEVFARVSQMALQPGSIILFHDDSPAGTEALERLIPMWRAAGLEFATL